MNTSRHTGLFKKMRRVAILPPLLLGIVITFVSYIRFSNAMYDEAENNMHNLAGSVAEAYDIAYPGDYSLKKNSDDTYDLYKGNICITDDYSIVDSFAVMSDTDISILYMDMRIHTTFETGNGTRLAGICTNEATADSVLYEGNTEFYKNIKIIDRTYLVLYVPLKNSDGSIIGMVEVAREMETIKLNVLKAVWPILLIAVLVVGLAVFYSYRNTKDITGVLKKLQYFLNKVSQGDLQVELDTALAKRDDELGDISKSSVQMQRSIRNFVETDPLTGLYNRRYVQNAVKKIGERQSETGQPFSVAITDIDFFKKVNDTYGHNAGDEVLKAVASILKTTMQGNGFAARWGGEEFVLVFDKCGMVRGAEILRQILKLIREMTVETEGYTIKITMTLGIVDGHGTNVEAMVEAADEKLYYGKTHGRNQVVCEVPSEDGQESIEENKE